MDFNFLLNFFLKPKLFGVINHQKNKFIFFIFLMFVSVVITSVLSKLIINLIDSEFNSFVLKKRNESWGKYSMLNNFFYIVFIGPLIEEIIHRKWLDFKKNSFYFSLIVLLILLIKNSIQNINLINIFYLLLIFILFVVIYFVNENRLKKFANKYYFLIFYFSCVLFALIHISNYTSFIKINNYYFLPLLILPQFVMGMFFGFFRVKFGFKWGLLSHSIMNLPAVLIYLASK